MEAGYGNFRQGGIKGHMAFDEQLGRRIASILDRKGVQFTEKRMFGGLGFMIGDKMCIGVVKDELMLRVLDEEFEEVLSRAGVREMDFTSRPMKGFVYVGKPALDVDKHLGEWVDLAVEFGRHGVVKSKRKKRSS